jgi:hypothetical protein
MQTAGSNTLRKRRPRRIAVTIGPFPSVRGAGRRRGICSASTRAIDQIQFKGIVIGAPEGPTTATISLADSSVRPWDDQCVAPFSTSRAHAPSALTTQTPRAPAPMIVSQAAPTNCPPRTPRATCPAHVVAHFSKTAATAPVWKLSGEGRRKARRKPSRDQPGAVLLASASPQSERLSLPTNLDEDAMTADPHRTRSILRPATTIRDPLCQRLPSLARM